MMVALAVALAKKAYLSCSSSRTVPITQELPSAASGTGRKPMKVRFSLQPHVSGIVMRTESMRPGHSPWTSVKSLLLFSGKGSCHYRGRNAS